MLYKYETHLHTKEGSKCSNFSGRDMAIAAKEAGYAGIIVTDHNWGGNTAIDPKLSWSDWVYQFQKGYEIAKKTGDEIGLSVFWGWEAGFQGTEFLIYGLSADWLLHHPEMKEATIEEQYQLVKAGGGIVIHAHPFREEYYIKEIRLCPDYIDGVEVINAMHSNPRSGSHFDLKYNPMAYEYAIQNDKLMTAGSDIHSTNLLGGGMVFEQPLSSIEDFVSAVKNKEAVAMTDGHETWTGECLYSKNAF